jgi:hypothetical protein
MIFSTLSQCKFTILSHLSGGGEQQLISLSDTAKSRLAFVGKRVLGLSLEEAIRN